MPRRFGAIKNVLILNTNMHHVYYLTRGRCLVFFIWVLIATLGALVDRWQYQMWAWQRCRQIVDLILKSPNGTTRAQIARDLGLSRAAVTQNVKMMTDLGLIRDHEQRKPRSGRRPIAVEIDPRATVVVGIEIGVTHLLVVLADASSRILAEASAPSNISNPPRSTIMEVCRMVESLSEEAHIASDRIDCICAGIPGPVDYDKGVVIAPPIMPGWDRFPVRGLLEDFLGHPTVVDNDANLGAIGEFTFGAGRGVPNLIFVKVGTGVGLGIVLGGKLYRGESGAAGEIGHMVLVENGPLCACGNRGCLEALAGGGAIARQASELVRSGSNTLLASMDRGDNITTRDVAEAASKGDHECQQLFAKAGQYIGVAVAGIVNLLNPGLVVIGGGVAQAGDLLLEPIRMEIVRHTLQLSASSVRVTSASLQYRSGAMGSVAVALSQSFDRILRAHCGK
jgi:glucokinase-like ROK family protein